MEFIVPVTLDLENLADALASQFGHEDLLNFIADLDLAVADWDFTEQLFKWAKNEHKMYKAEKKEYGF
jgi:hypothetical protein